MKLSLLVAIQATSCLAFSTHAGRSSPDIVSPLTHPTAFARRSTSLPASSSPFDFLEGIFSSSSGSAAVAAPAIPDVVVDTDYKLAAAFGAVGGSILANAHNVGGVLGGGFIALLAILFAVQATRLRFVFDEDSFELKSVADVGSSELTDSGENIVVGGANRWTYDSFVNWDFYPSVDLPILVYFKETQTPKEDGSEPGQIHFFPCIANAKQLEEQVRTTLYDTWFTVQRISREI